MLKAISKLKGFGVFDGFVKTDATQAFGPKNIIYGWNYSGKTTLSRFFSMLGSKAPSQEFPACRFSVIDDDGNQTNETIPTAWTHPIAVFNSNFIADNLRWDGTPFQPILLLGEDSIDAQKRIDACTDRMTRCAAGVEEKRSAVRDLNAKIAEAKTATAKHIKQSLGIVEAYNATHLSAELQKIDAANLTRLSAEEVAASIRLANAAEKDKLPAVPTIDLGASLSLYERHAEAKVLVAETPAFSRTIAYLSDNPEVANWVEIGLPLHGTKFSCEFCSSELTAARMSELNAHFSQDFSSHKGKITSLLQQTTSATLKHVDVVALSLNPQFRDGLPPILGGLNKSVDAYNEALRLIESALDAKAASAYSVGQVPEIVTGLDKAVEDALACLNDLLKSNNGLSDDFPQRKKNAIQALKRDFAIEFYLANELVRVAEHQARWERHAGSYVRMEGRLRVEIKALKAKISQAQKGREEINLRIVSMLGCDSIQIAVINFEGEDRFQLSRRGEVARNLSDGERTAVAFSFFLTKLREHKKFKDVIVYIDDPISSLDSNHIFQVYAIINELFFVQEDGGQKQWVTTCRQLFISTHNFEFFTLLRKLPAAKNSNTSRYFMVKRLSPAQSTLIDLPPAIYKHTSEYHYLFGVLHQFKQSQDKQDIEILLMLPNAVRRFLELYTYARLPLADSTVDSRAEALFGTEKGARIVKLLHYFSHLESVDRLAANPDVVSNIGEVIDEIFELVKVDEHHYGALEASMA